MLLRQKPSSQIKGIDQSKCKYAGIYHTLPREAEVKWNRFSTEAVQLQQVTRTQWALTVTRVP